MLNAYQLRLQYKNEYQLNVASFFWTPCKTIYKSDISSMTIGIQVSKTIPCNSSIALPINNQDAQDANRHFV